MMRLMTISEETQSNPLAGVSVGVSQQRLLCLSSMQARMASQAHTAVIYAIEEELERTRTALTALTLAVETAQRHRCPVAWPTPTGTAVDVLQRSLCRLMAEVQAQQHDDTARICTSWVSGDMQEETDR